MWSLRDEGAAWDEGEREGAEEKVKCKNRINYSWCDDLLNRLSQKKTEFIFKVNTAAHFSNNSKSIALSLSEFSTEWTTLVSVNLHGEIIEQSNYL